MKDTILTAKRKKLELMTLLGCFILANLANLYAIIAYKTPFTELVTSIFYVLIFTCALYVFWGILRILFYGVKAIFTNKRRRKKN